MKKLTCYNNLMNTNIILNISILTATLLFNACSTSQDKIKTEPLSIYNIMGITHHNNHFSETITPQTIEPQPTPSQIIETSQKITPLDISYISYREPKKVLSDITYVSYKKPQYPINHNFQTINNIENRAKSFLGVPYVWGATGPHKFDCSGFTQWVYRDSGINIPRVSKDQARVGEFVTFDNLQRGDMVFFDTKKKRTGRVTHVGIYLGNNNFIHASSAGKSVVIYNFNEKTFYKKRFLWGRRVLRPNFQYALN